MAEIRNEVILKAIIDSRGAKKGAEEVERSTDKISKGAKKSTSAFGKLTAAVKNNFGVIAAGVGVFSLLSANIRTTIKFTSAISDLSAITGATGKDLQFFSDAAREMGATTTLSASQAAEAFKLVASAKPDLLENAKALEEVTEQAVLLAEASGSTLPDAANTVGASLNQFGAEANQAARFVNVLAAGAKFGASEIGFTSRALKEAGTVAKTVGLSFEETNAAIQALASRAIKGSQAGTQLRAVLLKMSTQADESINPSIVGMATAFENLKEKQLPLIQLQKLFGLESVAAGQALVDQAGGLETLTEKLTGTATAIEQARVKVDNLEGDLKKLNSIWEEFNLIIGLSVNGVSRLVVQLGTKLVEIMSANPKIGEASLVGITSAIDLLKSEIETTTQAELKLDVEKAKGSLATLYLDINKIATVPTREEFYKKESTHGTSDISDFGTGDRDQLKTSYDKGQQALKQVEQQLANEEQLRASAFVRREEMINTSLETGIINSQRANELKLQNEKKYLAEIAAEHKKSEDNKNKLAWQSANNIASSLVYVTSVFKDQSNTAFKIHQAFASTQAAINTYQGITKAWAQGGVFGAVGAAAVGAAGAAQIYKILSASPGSAGGASLSSSSVTPTAIQEPAFAQQQNQQQVPAKQIIINIEGFSNVESIRSDIVPALKEIINEEDEILFNDDSRQAQVIRDYGT